MKNILKGLPPTTFVAAAIFAGVSTTGANAVSAPPTTDPITAISAQAPSQANPFITLKFDSTYEGSRWISVEWGCPATKSNGFVLRHRDYGDDAASVLIANEVADSWQRAVSEIWTFGYPLVVVAGPDFLDIQLSDWLNTDEMEATAKWINGILGYHDVCDHRPNKGGPGS